MIHHSSPSLGPEEAAAVLRVLESGHLARGPRVAEFERAMAEYVGRRHGIAVSSGLAALHLALGGLGLLDGDGEVVLPSYTCDALLQAIGYCRLTPVLVDVDRQTRNMTAAGVKARLSPRTRAIVVPHNFGVPAEIDQLCKLGVPVIEDCATAIGARYLGRMVGAHGTMAVLSFYATKMLTTGEGGMVLTDDPGIAETLRDLRDYRGHTDFRVRFGYSLSDLAGAIGLVQLGKLPGFVEQRKMLAEEYTRLLQGAPVGLPEYDRSKCEPAFYRFVVELKRDRAADVRAALARWGVETGHGVLAPLHRLLGLDDREFPVSAQLAERGLSLPIHPSLSVEDVRTVVARINEVVGERL